MDAHPVRLVLRKNEDRRLFRGDPWVYAGEILSPLGGIEPGAVAEVFTADGRFVGSGFVNPKSTIAVRILSRNRLEPVDADLIRRRIETADRLRRRVEPENTCYRMVFGEADRLPGLVIDRFAGTLVLQVTTAGIERWKETIVAILAELVPGAQIIEKSIAPAREKEGLAPVVRVVTGGETACQEIEINGLVFAIDFLHSQKTGFFLDQRLNYRLLAPLAGGQEVLDCFSYVGAWGLHAAAYGARHVEFLEISPEFLAQTARHIARNGLAPDRFTLTQADAIVRLREMSDAGVQKDLIVLDPPAFVKSRTKVLDAARGYREINLRALKMVRPGGFLITCSCSHFLSRDDFLTVVGEAAADAGRQVKLLICQGPPPDHGFALNGGQSDYLKCALLAVY
ncbi:MAG TPA: class I SAM-dependent rRNA methyltransferase [Candidatus Aminicenantes bacterium]|nr:class I SAM-dependent rRNA methyltransferase [Candidatus Aminicenantes bacterium]